MVENPQMGRPFDAACTPGAAFERLSAILETALDAIMMCNDERRYVFANDEACKLFRVERSELIGRLVDDFAMAEPLNSHWSELMETGTFAGEFTIVKPGAAISRVQVRASANCLPGIHIAFIRDISDRARLISESVDAERLRLAQDLHDSVGQSLALIKLTLQKSAHGGRSDELEPLSLIDDLIRQIRTMIFDLHPGMLEDLGLVPTLEHYTEQLQKRTGLPITITEHGERRSLAPPAPYYLFRAAKELLANAVKHARAEHIMLKMDWRPHELRLSVKDDGVGMPTKPSAERCPPTLGLVSVRERAAALGGHVQIDSRPGQGTTVTIYIALPDNREDEKRTN